MFSQSNALKESELLKNFLKNFLVHDDFICAQPFCGIRALYRAELKFLSVARSDPADNSPALPDTSPPILLGRPKLEGGKLLS